MDEVREEELFGVENGTASHFFLEIPFHDLYQDQTFFTGKHQNLMKSFKLTCRLTPRSEGSFVYDLEVFLDPVRNIQLSENKKKFSDNIEATACNF